MELLGKSGENEHSRKSSKYLSIIISAESNKHKFVVHHTFLIYFLCDSCYMMMEYNEDSL